MINDLECQNVLAKELLNTLETIKAAWDELPGEEEVNDLAKATGNVAASLNEAREQWDNLPGEDEVNDLARAAGNMADSLRNTE